MLVLNYTKELLIIFYYFLLFLPITTILNITGKASNLQILFQTPGSLNMEDLIYLHHYILLYLIIIFIFVCFMTLFCYSNFKINNNYFLNLLSLKKYSSNINRGISYETVNIHHNSLLEFIWTLFPSLILLLISVPSFLLLYSVEETINPSFIIKVIAHQWYWVYETIKN